MRFLLVAALAIILIVSGSFFVFAEGGEEATDQVEVIFNNTTPYGDSESKMVDYNGTVEPLSAVEPGFTFEGWFADADCTESFDFSKPITETTEIYGKWGPGNLEEDGMPPEEETAPGETGEEETGEETGEPADDGAVPEEETAPEEVEVYFIDVDPDDYTKDIIMTVKKGDRVQPPAVEEKDKYTFNGWVVYEEMGDDSVPFDPNSPIEKNTFVHADWIKPWQVVFSGLEPNNYEASETIIVKHGETVNPPKVTEKDKYTFNGWKVSDESGNEIPFDPATPIEEYTFVFAEWLEPCMVIFTGLDPDNYDIREEILVKHGETVKPPEITEKGNYTFMGWYDDSREEFDFSTPITEFTHINAQWIYPTPFVFYNAKPEGTWEETTVEVTVKHNTPVTPLTAENTEYWTFDGWYADWDYTEPFDFSKPIIREHSERVSFAVGKWTKSPDAATVYYIQTHPVYIDPVSKTIKKGTTAEPVELKEYDGWTFEGWYEDNYYTTTFDFSKPITEDEINIYAKWKSDSLIHIDNVRLYADFPKSPENLEAPKPVAEDGANYDIVDYYIVGSEEGPWYYVEVKAHEGYYIDNHTYFSINDAGRFSENIEGRWRTFRLLTWDPVKKVEITADPPKAGERAFPEGKFDISTPTDMEGTYWLNAVTWSDSENVNVEFDAGGSLSSIAFTPQLGDDEVFTAGKTYYRVALVRGVPYMDESTEVYWNGSPAYKKVLLYSGEYMLVIHKYTLEGETTKAPAPAKSSEAPAAAPPKKEPIAAATGDESNMLMNLILLMGCAGLTLVMRKGYKK